MPEKLMRTRTELCDMEGGYVITPRYLYRLELPRIAVDILARACNAAVRKGSDGRAALSSRSVSKRLGCTRSSALRNIRSLADGEDPWLIEDGEASNGTGLYWPNWRKLEKAFAEIEEQQKKKKAKTVANTPPEAQNQEKIETPVVNPVAPITQEALVLTVPTVTVPVPAQIQFEEEQREAELWMMNLIKILKDRQNNMDWLWRVSDYPKAPEKPTEHPTGEFFNHYKALYFEMERFRNEKYTGTSVNEVIEQALKASGYGVKKYERVAGQPKYGYLTRLQKYFEPEGLKFFAKLLVGEKWDDLYRDMPSQQMIPITTDEPRRDNLD